jgi:hypothetical protein
LCSAAIRSAAVAWGVAVGSMEEAYYTNPDWDSGI